MDLAVDELDYEDDEVTNSSVNVMKDVVNSKTDLPGVNESYLQLDCSEEDEWLVSAERSLDAKSPEGGGNAGVREAPSRSVTPVAEDASNSDKRPPETGTPEVGAVENPETESDEKCIKVNKKPRLSDAEEKEEEEEDGETTNQRTGVKQSLVNERVQQQQYPDAMKPFTKTEGKKRVWTRRPTFRRRLQKSFNEPWLPGFGFSNGCGPVPPPAVAFPNSGYLLLQRHHPLPGTTPFSVPVRHPLQTEKIIPPLMALNHGFVNANPQPVLPITSGGESDQTWCSTQQNQLDPVGSFGSIEAKGDDKSARFPSSRNAQPKEGKQEVQMRSLFDRDNRDNHVIKLNCLQGDEAELLKLRKEARLKRFSNDGDVKKEKKPLESNTEVSIRSAVSAPTDSTEAEKGKVLQFGDEQKDNKSFGTSGSLGLLSIKKEVLLQKRNPFELADAGKKVTQEKEILPSERVKVERVEREEGGGSGEDAEGREESEWKASRGFDGGELFCVKSDAGSQVRFVRTISKSLDELGIARQRPEARSGGGEFPLSARNSSFGEEELQQEVGCHCERERHLTGCIVKVLNVPPSTTTNDVLRMCNSVGKVKELKLNLPKENSVVIRFADPTSAEKFFSLYHGQKLKEYFLNVIVV